MKTIGSSSKFVEISSFLSSENSIFLSNYRDLSVALFEPLGRFRTSSRCHFVCRIPFPQSGFDVLSSYFRIATML